MRIVRISLWTLNSDCWSTYNQRSVHIKRYSPMWQNCNWSEVSFSLDFNSLWLSPQCDELINYTPTVMDSDWEFEKCNKHSFVYLQIIQFILENRLFVTIPCFEINLESSEITCWNMTSNKNDNRIPASSLTLKLLTCRTSIVTAK